MNRQSQWLFEAPVDTEVIHYVKPDRMSESYYNRDSEYEDTPSQTRRNFETALRERRWQDAFLNLNGLNMYEMLRAIEAANTNRFDELWLRRTNFVNAVNMPRIHYARNVVLNKVLPDIAVGDLWATGQVGDAANFIAEKVAPVARAVNPNPEANIHIILLECNFYGINDKSHIAYVLASAHHESGMGMAMTERWVPTPAQRNYEPTFDSSGRQITQEPDPNHPGRLRPTKAAELGNNRRGDGFLYRGRGFVQITGRNNYTFYKDFLLGTRGLTVDLVGNPDRATESAIAAIIIAHGMRYGKFTGVSLSRFGTDCNYNFVRARQIVNALDRADDIANIAKRYRAAMN